MEVQSEAETEEEEELVEPAPVTCNLCGQAPYDWELFGEEIWEECNRMKEQGSDNKAVWYHAHKMYTQDQQPLPFCVRGEIMDSWPDPDHVYLRFHSCEGCCGSLVIIV